MSGGVAGEDQKGNGVEEESGNNAQETTTQSSMKVASELFCGDDGTSKVIHSNSSARDEKVAEESSVEPDVPEEKVGSELRNIQTENVHANAEIAEVAVDAEMLVTGAVSTVNTVPVQLEAATSTPTNLENSHAEPEAAEEITIDQTSHISVSGADTAQLTPVPGLPGVSLISADGGGEDGNAIYLLVTGPVDGDGSGAIAVDAFANATLHSVPVEVSSDGTVVTASHSGVSSAEHGGQALSDPVAEILSTITSVARNAQGSASQVTSSAGTSVSFPTATEMSLAQDILALASSALSSSYGTNAETKAEGSASAAEESSENNAMTSTSAELSEEEVKKTAIEHDNQQPDSEMPYFDNADLPHWARFLRDCRLVGDCYTGYVMNEMEMDKVLNMYKKETHSLFAIRQTPSPVREDGTVRLMWKSQYVPYDGIPFINVGRRATVMECEHGPRKKANAVKRAVNASSDEMMKKVPNLTCPARIFIKKVRKFPEYKVESEIDAKLMRQLQEQALKQLREGGRLSNGEIRFYMQLPLPSAHHYHSVPGQESTNNIVTQEKHHVDPQVVAKITEVVRQGFTGAFLVRQIARDYVEKELFSYGEAKPPRHDKSYFPPMIEIQNIIQSVQSEIAAGTLKPLPPPATPPLSNKPKKRKSMLKSTDDVDSSEDVGGFKKTKTEEMDDGKKLNSDLSESSISMESHGENGSGQPSTVSLTLPKSQLENLSVSNLTFDQLQQLAKIGLLALNNTAFGASPVSMAPGDIEQADEVNMATGEIHAADGVTVETPVEGESRTMLSEADEGGQSSVDAKSTEEYSHEEDEHTVTSEVATEVAASLVTS